MDLCPSCRVGPMRSTTISSSMPEAGASTGTVRRARNKLTSALAILLLASAPRAGQPFLFPGKTSCPGAVGAAPTDQIDGVRLLRGSGSPLRGGALNGAGRPGTPGLNGVKPGEHAEVGRGGEGAGGKAGDDGASKSRGREAGFGTRAKSPAIGRRRKAWTNEGGSSALESAAGSEASTEVQEDSGSSESFRAVEPDGEDRSSAAVVPTAGELLVKAREMFEEMFGEPADPQEVSAGYAPGRVNLIGEHTDYNGGFVMPLALDRGTVLYGTGRLIDAPEQAAEEEACCRVVSESVMLMLSGSGEMGLGDVTFRADASLAPGEPEWANYVKGVVKEYMAKIPEGKTLAFKAIVVSTVPIGGGVSSSASLCVATATFLDGVLESAGVVPPSRKEKAHMCRMAEHRFMNMPCGIMDQFVTSMAEAGHAMLLDCRSEDPEDVPLMDPGLVIVVTNSNVKHKLAGSQYPVRVAQCEMARDELRKRHPEVELLRDASGEQVEEIQGEVEQAVFRRARHVVSENSRTVATAEALGKKDYGAVGRYMVESHHSLREDYEVSCPEIDALVELAMEVEGVYGSRITGGGFGGCTVTLADKESVETLVGHLREGYQRSMGKDCSCFVTKPGFGARGLTGAAALSASKWPNT